MQFACLNTVETPVAVIENITDCLTFLVLDLCLDILDGVAGLNLKGDGLPRQRLHEDLHVCRLREEIPR